MKSHQQRVWIVCGLAAVCVVALAVAGAMGASPEVLSALGTACGLLVPAAADALGVESRRVTPGKKAIEDDVDPDGDSMGVTR